jgi:hypothetical protein
MLNSPNFNADAMQTSWREMIGVRPADCNGQTGVPPRRRVTMVA